MEDLRRLASSCILPGFEGPSVPDWVRRRIDEGLGGVVLYRVERREPRAAAALTASCARSARISSSQSTRRAAT